MKATVQFKIESPLPVIASGLPRDISSSSSDTSIYHFEQKVPIPSYLFALASGDIKTAEIGPRSNVATGPDELAAAKWEMEEDMERFIVAAEKILGSVPYAWGTYNVLVLPPSFPYGGEYNDMPFHCESNPLSRDGKPSLHVCYSLHHLWRQGKHRCGCTRISP